MNGSSKVPHPIPYQGSKRQIAPIILSHFPHRFDRLVEPFAGSAAISIAVAIKNLTGSFWINDAHTPLIHLWKAILDNPEQLAAEYESLWRDQLSRPREYFDEVRYRFNELHQPADLLYLLARCVKAVIRYNNEGKFNNTPDNRRLGARPEEMRRRLLGASELLAGKTKVTALDYKQVLAQCDSSDVVYMDPPYQGVCGERDQRYAPRVERNEFCDELQKLNDRGVLYVVSYDGRTGDKTYGEPLPSSLDLVHLEIDAGRSTQATLLGRDDITYESLYLSSTLVAKPKCRENRRKRQLTLA